MTDALGYALFAGCLWAAAGGRYGWMVALFSVGLFEKETILLVPLALLLLPGKARKSVLFLLPSLLVYFGFRLSIPSVGDERWFGNVVDYLAHATVGGGAWSVAFHAAATFGFFWVLAAFGWSGSKRYPPLDRWRFLVIPILLAPFVFVTNVQRIWAYAFPLVIPLAVIGLLPLLRQNENLGRRG
jgi:hypothetical protein